MSEDTKDKSPTQGGTCFGFMPMWRFKDKNDEWRRIETLATRIYNKAGIPYPWMFGGVIEQIGLYGEAQSMAIAFDFEAQAEAEAQGKRIEIRVDMYEIKFNIECEKIKEIGL